MRRILIALIVSGLGVFGTEVSPIGLQYEFMIFSHDPAIALLQSVKKIGLFDVVKSQIVWETSVPRAWQTFGLPALSPDGNLLAVTCRSGDLLIWDVALRELRASYKVPPFCMWLIWLDERHVLLSGRYLCDNTHIIDITNGKILKTFSEASCPVAVSPNGELLAAAVRFVEGQVRVWNITTGEVAGSFDFPGEVADITFDRTGTLIAVGVKDGKIYVCDVPKRTVAKVLEQDSPVNTLRLNLDGRLLAASSQDDRIVIWTFPEGEKLVEVDVREELRRLGLLPDLDTLLVFPDTLRVFITSWSPDGKAISFSCRVKIGFEAFILSLPAL